VITNNYNIKAVLFDLDGVVVFTDRYHYLGWKRLCDEEGWRFDEVLNHQLRGVPRLDSLEIILKHNGLVLGDPQKAAYADRKNDYYVTSLQDINENDLYPGALDFINELRKRGIKTALCSSSRNASLVLEKLVITALFDTIVTGHDIRNAKPAPDIFLLAAQKIRVHPLHCMVFEDAASGVQAAKAARMKCVGVGTHEVLTQADETIAAYDEIDVEALLETGRKTRIAAESWY
jgi:beta-phosphoglucomutase